MRRRGRIGIELAAMVAIGLIAALVGPFGTFAAPFLTRLVQWLLFIVGGYCFFRPVIAAGSALAEVAGTPRSVALAVACALAALPTTLLVAWCLAGMAVARAPLGMLASLYPQVLLVGGLITLLRILLDRRQPGDPPLIEAEEPVLEPSASTEPPTSPLLDRLPPGFAGPIIALENEDHYVRVHSRAGSALVLMRMRDAVATLPPGEGMRTHRSWWVARDAVVEVLRRDRAVALRLVNGLEVPVARNEAPALRAAGWLAP